MGFLNFYHYRLLRKRNIYSMRRKIDQDRKDARIFQDIYGVHKGWKAYAKWGATYNLRKKIKQEIIDILWNKT